MQDDLQPLLIVTVTRAQSMRVIVQTDEFCSLLLSVHFFDRLIGLFQHGFNIFIIDNDSFDRLCHLVHGIVKHCIGSRKRAGRLRLFVKYFHEVIFIHLRKSRYRFSCGKHCVGFVVFHHGILAD